MDEIKTPVPQNPDKILSSSIEEELKGSYLMYALSVIVSRAIPDVRDGLKPVQRRILYAMYRMGLLHTKKFRKSATVVGGVIGSYHPHGDMPVYDALVRMAQDFSLRYPSVEGQGNFGSIDGDPPAAHRYTEARLSRLGESLLTNIEKSNVEFTDNFDATKKEPRSIPSPLPLLLLNGATGIAVGLATTILPHNITEVIEAVIYFIEHKECKIADLLKYIQGPDFPTGGIIISPKSDIVNFYETGRGKIVVRSKYEIENDRRIVITEIPYQVNKAETLKKIATLVKDKKIDQIKELRDESNKSGIRVVIELKKGADAEITIRKLLHFTDLQKSFHGNFVALKDGIEPKTFNLKEYFEEFLKYRVVVITRELNHDLAEAKKRVEILEGLKKALDNIDEVIALIKKSSDRADAMARLMKFLKINETQANAILEMRLERLARLEQQKILDELKALLALINDLEKTLASPAKIEAIVKERLLEIKARFKDDRRTEIHAEIATSGQNINEVLASLVEKKPNVIILAQNNYIKRLDNAGFKTQRRGGVGLTQKVKDNADIIDMIECFSTDQLYFVSDKGKLYQANAYAIPESERTKAAFPLSSLIKLEAGEKIVDMANIESEKLTSYTHFVFLAKSGLIKKVEIAKFKLIKQSGVKVIKLENGDQLLNFSISKENAEVLIATHKGQGVRFDVKKLRAQGKASYGVRALRFKKQGDTIQGALIINDPQPATKVLITTDRGYGKIIDLATVRKINRGGSGVTILKINDQKGGLAAISHLRDGATGALITTKNGMNLQLKIEELPTMGRNATGVRIIRLDDNDHVASIIVF